MGKKLSGSARIASAPGPVGSRPFVAALPVVGASIVTFVLWPSWLRRESAAATVIEGGEDPLDAAVGQANAW